MYDTAPVRLYLREFNIVTAQGGGRSGPHPVFSTTICLCSYLILYAGTFSLDMASSVLRSAHTFHIPVMGTGFTIDTPLRVAKYGIS